MPGPRLISVSVCLFAISYSPPVADAQDLWIGGRGGIATARFTAAAEDWEHRTGLDAGGMIAVPFTEWIGVHVEVLLSSRNSYYSAEDLPRLLGPPGMTPAGRVALRYMTVPITGQLRGPHIALGRLYPTLNVGAALSVLLSCHHASDGPDYLRGVLAGESAPCSASFAPSDVAFATPARFGNPRAVDISFVAGGGVALRVGPSELSLELRYTRGLLGVDRLAVPDVRTESWGVAFGWARPVALRSR